MFELNETTTSEIRVPPWIQYRTFHTIWFFFSCVLSISGTTLNFVLFFGIVFSKKLRTGSGALIAHSVFIDAIVSALAIPLITVPMWTAQYGQPSGNQCRWSGLFFYALVWASNWAPVPIAANRFVAICIPHLYDRICYSKILFVLVVTFSWTVPLACSLLYFFEVSANFQSVKPWDACGQIVTMPREFSAITAVCTSFPMAVEGAAYISLFGYSYLKTVLRRRMVRTVVTSVEHTGNTLRLLALHNRRLRVTKMVFAAYVWSTVCYMSAPIMISAASALMGSHAFIILVVLVLLQLGYATSPVSRSDDCPLCIATRRKLSRQALFCPFFVAKTFRKAY